jgi:hypothetical protein
MTFVPRYGAYAAAFGALAGELTILVLWVVLGKWLLHNLRLDWTFALLSIAFSVFICLAYRPGDFLPHHVWGEQLAITAICAVATWLLARRALKTFGNLADAKPS